LDEATLNDTNNADVAAVRIGAAQYPIEETPTLEAWAAKVDRWVAEGVEQGAELLVFPEYAALEQAACFGRTVSQDLSASLVKVAEQSEARVAHHQALAKKYKVHILAGSGPVQNTDGHFVNVAQLVTPDGRVGAQEKLMMTPFEREWGVSAGSAINVFQTDVGCLAIAICYDVEFPLIARAMAEAGAEVLLVPSCTERHSGYNRVRTGALARALENTIVTVQAPTVGEADWSPAVDVNVGAAGIYVPAEFGVSDTGVIAQGGLSTHQWVTASVDLQRLRRVRGSGEMRNFSDWSRQPGARSFNVDVDVIDLRARVPAV
jgi:predicted amidohydrolase